MFQPIPAIIRFLSERVSLFIRFMLLCHDGEISSSVVLIIITIKRHGCGGGITVMWVCATLGCKAHVGVYRCSCPMWVSGLLSVLPLCLTLMSISYGLRVLPILCSCGDPCVQSVGSRLLVCARVHVFIPGAALCFCSIMCSSSVRESTPVW